MWVWVMCGTSWVELYRYLGTISYEEKEEEEGRVWGRGEERRKRNERMGAMEEITEPFFPLPASLRTMPTWSMRRRC